MLLSPMISVHISELIEVIYLLKVLYSVFQILESHKTPSNMINVLFANQYLPDPHIRYIFVYLTFTLYSVYNGVLGELYRVDMCLLPFPDFMLVPWLDGPLGCGCGVHCLCLCPLCLFP